MSNRKVRKALHVARENNRDVTLARHDVNGAIKLALSALRLRFDDCLASLQASDAGKRLRGAMRVPAKLGGKVNVGSST